MGKRGAGQLPSIYTTSVGLNSLGTHVVLLSPALTTNLPSYTPFVYLGHQFWPGDQTPCPKNLHWPPCA